MSRHQRTALLARRAICVVKRMTGASTPAFDASGPDFSASQQDRDAAAFAGKRAAFFRAVFVPSLSQALAPTRCAEERQILADRLEEGVRRRVASNAASLENMVGIIVFNKNATD